MITGILYAKDLLPAVIAAAEPAGGWATLVRLVRGSGALPGEASDDSRVLTVSRERPALVALDHDGTLLERVDA